jgi:hypothetical protein
MANCFGILNDQHLFEGGSAQVRKTESQAKVIVPIRTTPLNISEATLRNKQGETRLMHCIMVTHLDSAIKKDSELASTCMIRRVATVKLPRPTRSAGWQGGGGVVK